MAAPDSPSLSPVNAPLPLIEYHTSEGPEPSAKTSWQGHHFPPEIVDANTRISFTNIHGLCTKGTSLNEATNDLLASHQQYSIHLCGVSEHHLPMKSPKLSQRFIPPCSQGSEEPIPPISLTRARRSLPETVLASWVEPGS
jgi:hypothetical protein